MLIFHRTNLAAEAKAIKAHIPPSFIGTLKAWKFGQNTITIERLAVLPEMDETKRGFMTMDVVGAKYEIGPHTDPDFPTWSHFLILRNPGFYIGSVKKWRYARGLPQIVGSVLSLNIHELHWLATVADKPISPYWISASFATWRQLTTKSVVQHFRSLAGVLKASTSPTIP